MRLTWNYSRPSVDGLSNAPLGRWQRTAQGVQRHEEQTVSHQPRCPERGVRPLPVSSQPPCNKWLTLTPRLGLAILTASLFLGCSSSPVSETTGHPASSSTPDAQTKVQSRFQATAEAEPATTTSPLSVATPSSTLAPPAAPTPSPPATPAPVATSTPAPGPHTLPAIETPVPGRSRSHRCGYVAPCTRSRDRL